MMEIELSENLVHILQNLRACNDPKFLEALRQFMIYNPKMFPQAAKLLLEILDNLDMDNTKFGNEFVKYNDLFTKLEELDDMMKNEDKCTSFELIMYAIITSPSTITVPDYKIIMDYISRKLLIRNPNFVNFHINGYPIIHEMINQAGCSNMGLYNVICFWREFPKFRGNNMVDIFNSTPANSFFRKYCSQKDLIIMEINITVQQWMEENIYPLLNSNVEKNINP